MTYYRRTRLTILMNRLLRGARMGSATKTSAILLVLSLIPLAGVAARVPIAHAAQPGLQITSVDTMKESRDTETRPLSVAEIVQDVQLSARLGAAYITVDTHWDYPDYMRRWVNAVRSAGKHVWFRIHPNQWSDSNGTTGVMTPTAYGAAERAFILGNASLFRPGDILDPCPEPENGVYWKATYGSGWTANAPNAATREYSDFLLDTSTIAGAALRQVGVGGVITSVRSVNGFFAAQPRVLDQATVVALGRVTFDAYPDATTTDPPTAAAARLSELARIEQVRGMPVVIGEMGFSRSMPVDNSTQERVLSAELGALSAVPYLAGVNYWVGAGTDASGGFTHLFSGGHGTWTPRPAAIALSAYFAAAQGPQAHM